MSDADQDLLVVLCTVPDEEAGRRLARMLVERRLAACVNRLPNVTSVYWWQGEIQEDGEQVLVIKTRRELWSRLADAIEGAHPYDVPEIVALPMVECHEPYARWLVDSTAS